MMNRYFSSKERENMARLMAMVMVEEEAIKNYEKTKDPDKAMMKYLRMSHTFLEKAIARRYNLIDLDAAKQMKRGGKPALRRLRAGAGSQAARRGDCQDEEDPAPLNVRLRGSL